MFRIKSSLLLMPLRDLRPTQMTVGYHAVALERSEWAEMPAKRRRAQMEEQLFPAVKGPKDRFYILDHHHLARALLAEKVEQVRVGLVCDLSQLSDEQFWVYLDHRSWVHCYDEKGVRQPFSALPKKFEAMADDPFRSLAATVQKLGGFAKPDEPFLEFLWANFFRDELDLQGKPDDFEKATPKAFKLARSEKCAHLPGWSGTK